MKELEDYYMILQLHHLAEPEVIEGAYKKLAKKYHPDLNQNKNAGEKMKLLNRAYEELSDPARRQAYDLTWGAAHPIKNPAEKSYNEPPKKYEASYPDAKAALDAYFSNIKNNRFHCSYELASGIDKQNITCDDFISWQRAVTSVFHLKEYSYQIHRVYQGKLLNEQPVQKAVEFSVDVVEYNVVMNREERDSFLKTVVLEDGGWHVYIGYETLQPIIERFKELTDLLAAKSVMTELAERYGKRDSLTGLLNRNGMTEQIEREADRFERYGHAFSLLMIRVDIKKTGRQNIGREVSDLGMKSAGEILLVNLRNTDMLGRWDETTFLALLPETTEKGAVKAAGKLLGKLKHNILMHGGKPFTTTVKMGAVEYRASLKESLDRLRIG